MENQVRQDYQHLIMLWLLMSINWFVITPKCLKSDFGLNQGVSF